MSWLALVGCVKGATEILKLEEMGRGTSAVLRASGVPCEVTGKIHEGKSSVVDAIAAGEISLMINTPLGVATRDDGYELRRAAVRHGITYATTLAAAQALIAGMQAARAGELDVAPLQEL